METILYIAHTENDGSLGKGTLEALNAAVELKGVLSGAKLIAGFIGENVQTAANTIAGCGAGKMLGVSGPDYSQARYSSDIAAVTALAKAAEATIIIVCGTSRLNRVLPGAAHRLGGAADLHIAKITADGSGLTAIRWHYRQRMKAEYQRKGRPWLLAVDPGTYPVWSGAAGPASVESLDVALPEIRTKVTGLRTPSADEQTIRPEADLLFVAGAGWTKKQADGQTHTADAEKYIKGFLKSAQASLGSSKSLVDLGGEGQDILGFLTHLNQIGQTGATPRHPKGLSTCCHGEEPHVVGWRFINERRAINLNPNCGWAHGKTDVLYVADAFEVMKKVIELM
jgi:electron transfer flavoprotein alpha subunit